MTRSKKNRIVAATSFRLRSGRAGGAKRKRVLVAMSGGVDSSVAAALLKNQGFEITGVFMRLFGGGKADEQTAGRVARKLKISFKVVDFRRQFRQAVVDYFFHEYAAGRTPNPCVICNEKIKFGLLMERAQKMGADFMATGHYTRLRREIQNPKLEIRNKSQNPKSRKYTYKLSVAKDKQKDQSYFLYRLSQKQLSRVIFPLGGYTKEEVYKLAKKWRLLHKKESSADVCFMVGQKLEPFLKKHLKLRPGKIVDLNGKILGRHEGLTLYTMGQRASVGGPGPFYAIRKDKKKNQLVVSRNEKDLLSDSLIIKNVNWLAGRAPKLPLACRVKIRYKSNSAAVIVSKSAEEGVSNVKFKKPQRAITPGQSAVFYGRKGEILGGGTIV
jgi:tRNA-specific 2-thiouridylase